MEHTRPVVLIVVIVVAAARPALRPGRHRPRLRARPALSARPLQRARRSRNAHHARALTEIRVLDGRPSFITVEGQEILTADGVALKVSLAARYVVGDPVAAVTGDQSYERALHLELQLGLREVLAARTVDDILARAAKIGPAVLDGPRASSPGSASSCSSVDVRDVMVPGELKRRLRRRRRGAARRARRRSSGLAARRRRSAASRTPVGWSRTTPACSSSGCSSSSARRRATRCMLSMPDGQRPAGRRRRRDTGRGPPQSAAPDQGPNRRRAS